MERFSKTVVKRRKLILVICLILLIPSAFSFLITPVNYDIMTYLPQDMESVRGSHIFSDEFDKGAFAMIMIDDMEYKDVAKIKARVEKIPNVANVIWYDTALDISVPTEILPKSVYKVFNSDKATLMAVFLHTNISEDRTLEAIGQMRKICGKQAYISGMSSFVYDLKELGDKEKPIYVAIAVVLGLALLSVFMESFAIGLIFMAGIGMSILYNMGTNFLMHDVSYITFAIAAVLQLAVTMDYSIFLWHSYERKRKSGLANEPAMEKAISETLLSILGSSATTIAGFLALSFMTFGLGVNLGVIMAKGVVFGLLGSVTILPGLILTFDKLIEKTRHKTPNINFKKISSAVLKKPAVIVAVALLVIGPALYGYLNTEVYYKLDNGIPKDIHCIQASQKLSDEFGMHCSHILLLDNSLSQIDENHMIKELEQVDGVKAVIGMGSVLSPSVPREILPSQVTDIFRGKDHNFMMISSEYSTASDEVNAQIDEINQIVKSYDKTALLMGEAPGTKDLIKITDHDFKVVTAISVLVIFLIIALVFRSISLPIILVGCIELAILINLGIPFYTGKVLSFIDSICISTIQLGATVDYAILLTTKYKENRLKGMKKEEAVSLAHETSTPSILVSALSFFAATVGVAIYSNIDIISSMVGLMARGALISMLVVVIVLPSFLRVCDGFIIRTTKGMKKCKEA
ncbi:MAG: MMPL family transporter [Clostridia bacterium]|nr:MMPL family transporter [Clostridia bacterium]